MEDNKLRFKLKKGDVEVEVEGASSYVKNKFEYLLENFIIKSKLEIGEYASMYAEGLKGIIETTHEGRPYLAVPVDILTSKEAVALFLYALKPKKISDNELSEILTSGWKTMKAEAIRARASELRRDGKLVSENGLYTLSGAGKQWVEKGILEKIRKATKQDMG
jgi:hypothetical protein